jgi:hypothetical protein
MPIDYASVIYSSAQDTFGRKIVVTPLVSQPNASVYNARGIYTTEEDDVLTEEGAIFSDQRTIVDIIAKEFTVQPLQGDHVFIPADGGVPEAGLFEIIDTDDNGGGETTLSLRKVVTSKPTG